MQYSSSNKYGLPDDVFVDAQPPLSLTSSIKFLKDSKSETCLSNSQKELFDGLDVVVRKKRKEGDVAATDSISQIKSNNATKSLSLSSCMHNNNNINHKMNDSTVLKLKDRPQTTSSAYPHNTRIKLKWNYLDI